MDETDCISHSTNTFGKGMNPNILPPAMSKQQGRLFSSALVGQLVQEKENSEFKPVKLRLKIDLVSHSTQAEGLGKYALNKETKPKKVAGSAYTFTTINKSPSW